MSDIAEAVKQRFEECGVVILMETEVCRAWRTSHENCTGCISDEGCGKYVTFLVNTRSPIEDDILLDLGE